MAMGHRPARTSQPRAEESAQQSTGFGDLHRISRGGDPRHLQAVATGVAGHDMDVEMEHGLPRGHPQAFTRFTPSAPSLSSARPAMSWASAEQAASSSGAISIRSAACFLGITSACPRVAG